MTAIVWPPPSSFRMMLQHPRQALRIPELQECSFERDGLGQPRAWSGSFATVYRAIHPSGRSLAVRVFSSAVPERRTRYAAIYDHFRCHQPRCLVSFEYHEEAIRCTNGNRYPLVTMEWVDGETLFEWLGRHCEEKNQAAILRLSQQWIELIADLERHRICHGDLQHANVMVSRSGDLQLVDYDGMCVPALHGQRSLELGIVPYQHPMRDSNTLLSPELDRFSAIVIFVALRALAADASLWSTFVTRSSYDKILFRRDDFTRPEESPLFADLSVSIDTAVRRLADQLLTLYQAPLLAIPTLAAIVQKLCPSPQFTPIWAEHAKKLDSDKPSSNPTATRDGRRQADRDSSLERRPPPAPLTSHVRASSAKSSQETFARVEEVAGLVAAINDGVLTLQWTWPEGVETCAVVLGHTRFPAGVGDPQANTYHYGRFQYEHMGGFRIPVQGTGSLFVIVYAAVR